MVAVINGSGSLLELLVLQSLSENLNGFHNNKHEHSFFLLLVAITRTGGVEIGCKENLNSNKTNTIW